jgi:hypothetical protein
MIRRGMTMLELLFSLAIMTGFVVVYVAWSGAMLQYNRTIERESHRIVVTRGFDWIVRDIRDRVEPEAFEEPDEEEEQSRGPSPDEIQAKLREILGDSAPSLGTDTETEDTEDVEADADDEPIINDREIELISPHPAPGDPPGFYEVRYHLRNGSLIRTSRPKEGSVRSFTVTQSGSFSGDDREVIRDVEDFRIEPIDDDDLGAGVVITLVIRLPDGGTSTHERIIRDYP